MKIFRRQIILLMLIMMEILNSNSQLTDY